MDKGDITQIHLADGATVVKALGTVNLWLQVGKSQVQHRFLVLPLGVQAILGSDFFGTFGSTLN